MNPDNRSVAWAALRASPIAWAALPVAWTLAADGWARRFAPLDDDPSLWGFYGLSVAYAWLGWCFALSIIRVLRRRGPALMALVASLGVAVIEALLLVSALVHHQHFAVLPNVYAISYLFDEPREFFASVEGGATWLAAVITMAYAVLVVIYLQVATSTARSTPVGVTSLRRRMVTATLLVAAWAAGTIAVQNNVRLYPNCFLPQVHTVAAFMRAALEQARGIRRPTRSLVAGTRPQLVPSETALPFNIVVLLNESLGRRHMSTYGYRRETTPQLSRFLREHADRAVLFALPYANATRTVVALPSLLTGVGPAEPVARTYREPLLFDYMATSADTHVFAITAQSWRVQIVDGFVDSKGLLTRSTMDTRGRRPGVNKVSSDDIDAVVAFEEMLAAVPPAQRVAGLVQFYGTHLSYYSDAEDQLWPIKSMADAYDAAIHKVDRLTARVVQALEKHQRLDDTLLIVTSDHGQAFGEHGYSGHMQTFYDEESAVPMWVHLPEALLRDPGLLEVVRQNAMLPVSNLDLVPTVLDAMAKGGVISRPTKLLGSSLLSPLPPERAIIMLNAAEANESVLTAGAGVVVWPYKYILLVRGGRYQSQLFDLSRDPLETADLWPTAPGDVQRRIREAMLSEQSTRWLFDKVSAP